MHIHLYRPLYNMSSQTLCPIHFSNVFLVDQMGPGLGDEGTTSDEQLAAWCAPVYRLDGDGPYMNLEDHPI